MDGGKVETYSTKLNAAYCDALRARAAQLESERDEALRLAEWSLGRRIPSLRRMSQRAHQCIRRTSAPWLGLAFGFGTYAAIASDVGVLCFAMFTAGVLAGLFGARSNVTVAMFDEIENTEGKEP